MGEGRGPNEANAGFGNEVRRAKKKLYLILLKSVKFYQIQKPKNYQVFVWLGT